MDYDIIIVGTGPTSLFEALYNKQVLMKKVLIVDKNHRIGGAWETSDLFGFSNLELGCHYLSKSHLAYHLLDEILGVELEPIERFFYDFSISNISSNIGIRNSELVANSVKTNTKLVLLSKVNRMIRAVLSGDVSTLKFAFRRLQSRGPFMYPKYGCHDLLHSLYSTVFASDIEVNLSSHIKRINSFDNLIECHIDDKIVTAKKICLGQAVRIPLYIGNTLLKSKHETVRSVHFILHISGKKEKDFIVIQSDSLISHWKDRSSYFFRITDIGRYSPRGRKTLNKDELLICCQVSSEQYVEDTSGEAILEYVKNLGLVSQNSKLLNWHKELHEGSMILINDFNSVSKRLPSNISIFRSWDLSYCIEKNYKRWKKIRIEK